MSIKLVPDFSASFANVWDTKGSMVLLSINNVPFFADLEVRKTVEAVDNGVLNVLGKMYGFTYVKTPLSPP